MDQQRIILRQEIQGQSIYLTPPFTTLSPGWKSLKFYNLSQGVIFGRNIVCRQIDCQKKQPWRISASSYQTEPSPKRHLCWWQCNLEKIVIGCSAERSLLLQRSVYLLSQIHISEPSSNPFATSLPTRNLIIKGIFYLSVNLALISWLEASGWSILI